MKRGEIYYIQRHDTYGSEIMKARPGVIVSNDLLNQSSEVVEVVYLTTQPKKNLPTHACVKATGVESTALCEQVDAVSVRLIGNYCGTCSPDEMLDIDRALCASLDLARPRAPGLVGAARMATLEEVQLLEKLERIRAERNRYAKMLDILLSDEEAG